MGANWIGILGMGAGAVLALLGRDQWDAWAKSNECCATKHAPTAQACPLHHGNDGKLAATDQGEFDRLRRAMRDGVFAPWVELGRAPTPDEVGQRLHLDAPAVSKLMDELESCGESFEVGVRRVPESDLIAVAWPLANVPTGITVTVDGAKPVQARCAVDSLGVSKMMGRKATIDAVTRDTGSPLHVVVDGDRLVSAEPPSAIVFKGAGCDEMLFFSSEGGLDGWKQQHAVEGGKVFAMNEAVAHGAGIFGQFTAGL